MCFSGETRRPVHSFLLLIFFFTSFMNLQNSVVFFPLLVTWWVKLCGSHVTVWVGLTDKLIPLSALKLLRGWKRPPCKISTFLRRHFSIYLHPKSFRILRMVTRTLYWVQLWIHNHCTFWTVCKIEITSSTQTTKVSITEFWNYWSFRQFSRPDTYSNSP